MSRRSVTGRSRLRKATAHKAEYEAERQHCFEVACSASGQAVDADPSGYAVSLGGALDCSHCTASAGRWCRATTAQDADGNTPLQLAASVFGW